MSAKLGVKEANLAVMMITAHDVTRTQQRGGFARRGKTSS